MSYVDTAASDVLSPRARRRRLRRRRLARRPFAIAGFVVAASFGLAAILAPWVAPYSASATDFNAVLAHASGDHLLGTDELGRDILSRIIWGARASMQRGSLKRTAVATRSMAHICSTA